MTVPHSPSLRYGGPPSDDGGRPLVVAVAAAPLRREVRGIGRYVRALLPRLVAQRPGLRFILFVKRRDVEDTRAAYAGDATLRDHVEVRAEGELRRARADLYWYPWNTATPLPPPHGAVVVTVHDIAPLVHPEPHPRAWQRNRRWKKRFGATARLATLIIADSAFTASEVHRVLGVPHERVRVVLLAADDFAAGSPPDDAATLARLGVREPFVLAVGAADGRKNLELLERALPRVAAAHPGVTLVLAGPREDARAPGVEPPWRRTLGFVTEAELAALYRHAAVLVSPSTYEGFGLPVLEAMQLGAPVIGARAASLPEVGGDAAAWVAPHDDGRLAALIGELLSDDALRARMRAASLAQAARFSWDETARRTAAAFEEAVRLHEREPTRRVARWRRLLGRV